MFFGDYSYEQETVSYTVHKGCEGILYIMCKELYSWLCEGEFKESA